MFNLRTFSFISVFILIVFSKANHHSVSEVENLSLEYLENSQPEGNKITSETCQEDAIFTIKKAVFNPPTIEKGQNVKMKVIGGMLADTKVKELFVQAFLNKNKMFEKEVPKEEDVKKGLWTYEYEVGVPKFVPTGHWETYVYVRDNKNKDISCIKVMFDI